MWSDPVLQNTNYIFWMKIFRSLNNLDNLFILALKIIGLLCAISIFANSDQIKVSGTGQTATGTVTMCKVRGRWDQ